MAFVSLLAFNSIRAVVPRFGTNWKRLAFAKASGQAVLLFYSFVIFLTLFYLTSQSRNKTLIRSYHSAKNKLFIRDYVHLSMTRTTISEVHLAAEVAQAGDTRYKTAKQQISRQLLVMFNEQSCNKNSKSKEMRWNERFMNNPLPEDYSPKISENGNQMIN